MSCGHHSPKDSYDIAHCPTTPLPPVHSQPPACPSLDLLTGLLASRIAYWNLIHPGHTYTALPLSSPTMSNHAHCSLCRCCPAHSKSDVPDTAWRPLLAGPSFFHCPCVPGLSMDPGQKKHQELMAEYQGTLFPTQLRASQFVKGVGIHSVTESLQQPNSVSPAGDASPAWSCDKEAWVPGR